MKNNLQEKLTSFQATCMKTYSNNYALKIKLYKNKTKTQTIIKND